MGVYLFGFHHAWAHLGHVPPTLVSRVSHAHSSHILRHQHHGYPRTPVIQSNYGKLLYRHFYLRDKLKNRYWFQKKITNEVW